MSQFPHKQIDQTRKKLEIDSKHITPSIKTFLSDFIQQIGNYISKNGLDNLIQCINDRDFVDTFQNISEKVIENQKLRKKFQLSFSPSDLQKRFPHKHSTKEDFIRIATLLEIVIGDILQYVEKNEKIEDIFTDSSNPFYDIFNETFSYSLKSPKISKTRKTPRKTSKTPRKTSKTPRKTSKTPRKTRKTPRKTHKTPRKTRKTPRKTSKTRRKSK